MRFKTLEYHRGVCFYHDLSSVVVNSVFNECTKGDYSLDVCRIGLCEDEEDHLGGGGDFQLCVMCLTFYIIFLSD